MLDRRKREVEANMNILEEADKTIGERQDQYGNAEKSFAKIAGMWEEYLGVAIDENDVAMMMILLKVARQSNQHKRDNLVDICGYAALAGELYNTAKEG